MAYSIILIFTNCKKELINEAQIANTSITQLIQQSADGIPFADSLTLASMANDPQIVDYRIARKLYLNTEYWTSIYDNGHLVKDDNVEYKRNSNFLFSVSIPFSSDIVSKQRNSIAGSIGIPWGRFCEDNAECVSDLPDITNEP